MTDFTNHPQQGVLVLFEGMDGVGKTTQVKRAEQVLNERGLSVMTSRTPGGTPIGEALREVMRQPLPRPGLSDLYMAAAAQEALIRALDELRRTYDVILLDRGPLSIAAYQIYGSRVDNERGWYFVDEGMTKLKPDKVIVYACNPEKALRRARVASGREEYFEQMPQDYFNRVDEGYHVVAKRFKAAIIQAEKDIDSVHRETMAIIDKVL
jgi:dTMP kinase